MSTNPSNRQAQLVEIAKAIGAIVGVPLVLFTLVNSFIEQPVIALVAALITAALASVWVVRSRRIAITQVVVAWLALIVVVLAGFVIWLIWPKTMTVEGIIRDTVGNPVNNEEVVLFDLSGRRYETKTNAEGYYQFVDVPAGKYKVWARGNEVEGATTGILVRMVQQNLTVAPIVVAVSPTPTPTDTPTPTMTNTPTPTDTPIPTNTPTPIPPIPCNHPSITENVFPQLQDVEPQYPFYGPVDDPNFLCQGVYDIYHSESLAVRIEYDGVDDNRYWGIGTPDGYDATNFTEICFWAYTQTPNQAFSLDMKDTSGREEGILIKIAQEGKWTQFCRELSVFSEKGVQLNRLENVNLQFKRATNKATVWADDFEFKP